MVEGDAGPGEDLPEEGLQDRRRDPEGAVTLMYYTIGNTRIEVTHSATQKGTARRRGHIWREVAGRAPRLPQTGPTGGGLVASAAARRYGMDLLQNLVFLREKGEEPHLHCGQTKYNQQNGSIYLTNKRVLWVPSGTSARLPPSTQRQLTELMIGSTTPTLNVPLSIVLGMPIMCTIRSHLHQGIL